MYIFGRGRGGFYTSSYSSAPLRRSSRTKFSSNVPTIVCGVVAKSGETAAAAAAAATVGLGGVGNVAVDVNVDATDALEEDGGTA